MDEDGSQDGLSRTIIYRYFPYREDLLKKLNPQKAGVRSRYTAGFGHPTVETDVMVRSALACPLEVGGP
jgi:hypothetical protein